jgi:Protein of unknown function (DUF4238)
VADAEPKRHHFVPRFYLARWSDHDQLAVQRRDGTHFLANPTNVAVINGFYDFRDDDGEVSKAVEKFLADVVEGPASSAFAEIDRIGRPPTPGTDEHHAMCMFIAFQMIRTPERRDEMMLAESVRTYLDGRDLTEDVMASYLESIHLGFAPSQREVRAAHMLIGYQLTQLDPGSREESMKIMYKSALTLAPRLTEMHMSVAVDRKERLITADQPVLLWKRPSRRDAFEGVGIATADEIRLPLDAGQQLVLKHRPRPGVVRLSSSEVVQCNRDIAARCHVFVAGSPRQSAALRALDLRARGPRARFDVGYRYVQDEHGQLIKTDQEILHTWVSRD